MKQSFIDFPGTLSAVIFTSGCNLNCWYCHNSQLIHSCENNYTTEQIINFLESRRGFLEGVVISGGEPTLQPDLIDFIKTIKDLGFKVKLDTNGTNAEVLQDALFLVDYVAMDIKNSLSSYPNTTASKPFQIENIRNSIDVLQNSSIPYEFRTTFVPEISLNDIEDIGKLICGAPTFYLQTYIPQGSDKTIHTPAEFNAALEIIKKYVKTANIR